MTHNPTAFRWPAYYLLTLILSNVAIVILISISMAVIPLDESLLVAIVGLPFVFVFVGLHLRCLFAYHEDAKHLSKTEADYQPRWLFWVGLQLLAGPVAPAWYLIRRRRRVGNDYTGTRLEHLFPTA